MADKRLVWFASFVLIVFCLGGVLGYRLGTHRAFPGDGDRSGGFGRMGPDGSRRGGPGPGRGRGGPPPALPPDMLNQLTRELSLDTPQQEQMKKVLEERRASLERVHQEARERFDAEQRDLFAAIRQVLRSDQQQAFDQFLERRPQRGRRGGGPRDGGPRDGGDREAVAVPTRERLLGRFDSADAGVRRQALEALERHPADDRVVGR